MDAACTFVMYRAEGGGLPVLLVPLTKPVQPARAEHTRMIERTTKSVCKPCELEWLLLAKEPTPRVLFIFIRSSGPEAGRKAHIGKSPLRFAQPLLPKSFKHVRRKEVSVLLVRGSVLGQHSHAALLSVSSYVVPLKLAG